MQDIEAALSEGRRILAEVSDTPELDTEVLLCLILDKNRSYLRTWPKKQLHTQQRLQFKNLLKQRQHGTPIAYMTGVREFWSRDFKVTPDVLIPRPDTELLVELSLALIPKDQPCKVIDLGTGSGVIAVTLAIERPQVQMMATDMSEAALKIAKQNAEHYHCRNIRFLHSVWFNDVTETAFDVIVSNPPYIAPNDPHLLQGDLRFEPQSALVSDDNGLKDIAILVESAAKHLKMGGHLLIEHGYNQQQPVQAMFESFGYADIQTHTDLGGNPRVTMGQWHS
jgi:release factor glutamine methyltransferase